MVAMKNLIFKFLLISDFQILDIPFRACHDRALRTAMSFSVLSTQDPRYLKSSTHSISVPSVVWSGVVSSVLKYSPLVFFAFMFSHTLLHSFSTLSRSSWACWISSDRREISSAKSSTMMNIISKVEYNDEQEGGQCVSL